MFPQFLKSGTYERHDKNSLLLEKFFGSMRFIFKIKKLYVKSKNPKKKTELKI
jgi:hypothetical protein